VHDIASTKSQLGLAAEAEVDARRALQLRRRALGDHRDTATALTTLGAVLAGTGRRTEARAAFEEALAMRRKVLPDATAAIGDSIRRLGSLARDEGDLATAETLYTEALENWRAELATDHPDVADVMFDLARVKRLRGDAAGARPLAEEVVRIRIAKFGIANGNTLAARDELASVLLDVKDWTAAETLLREAVALYEQKLRPGHPVIAYTGAQVGAALLGQGRVDEAEPLLLAGWAAIGEDPKFWAVNKLFLLDHLVLLYEARGDEERAATYRAKAAALRK